MDLGYDRCGECARRGLTACDGSGLEDSDCLFLSFLWLAFLLTSLVSRLKRAIDKAEAEEQVVLDLLQRNMSRLQRVRKQRELLKRRGSLMISKKAQTVEELEELVRLEDAAEAGDAVDPEGTEEGRSLKRLRGASSADTVAGPSQSVGSPGAGSGAVPPEGSELIDQARQSPLPEYSPAYFDGYVSFEYSETAVVGVLGFDGGTHQ